MMFASDYRSVIGWLDTTLDVFSAYRGRLTSKKPGSVVCSQCSGMKSPARSSKSGNARHLILLSADLSPRGRFTICLPPVTGLSWARGVT